MVLSQVDASAEDARNQSCRRLRSLSHRRFARSQEGRCDQSTLPTPSCCTYVGRPSHQQSLIRSISSEAESEHDERKSARPLTQKTAGAIETFDHPSLLAWAGLYRGQCTTFVFILSHRISAADWIWPRVPDSSMVSLSSMTCSSLKVSKKELLQQALALACSCSVCHQPRSKINDEHCSKLGRVS